MGRPAIKWGMVVRYFKAHGYVVRNDDGDAIIEAPKDNSAHRTRLQVRIGHNFSNHAGDELQGGHIQKLRRAFGVTWQDILKG
jgi:hypothetical protein